MKNFQDFITEGRDAPLYHGTSFENAAEIIGHNIFQSRTQHDSKLLGQAKQDYYSGVSFTRLLSKAKAFGSYIFELDQAKLVSNHKVRPVQWFYTPDPEGMLGARTRYKGRPGKATEAEEFVIGSIKNADKYIVALWVPEKYSNMVKEYQSGELKHSTQSIVFGFPRIKFY